MDFSSSQVCSLREASCHYGIPLDVLENAVVLHEIDYYKLGDRIIIEPAFVDALLSRKDFGTVYAIGFLNYVKIGHTTNFAGRLSNLQCAIPMPVSVYKTHRGFVSDERRLHKRFSNARLNGEWFKMSRAIRKWING